MLREFYPLISYFTAMGLSQLVKPLYHLKEGPKFEHIFESGGYISSHTAGTVTLALSIGFKEGFSSSYFAVALVFCLVVVYDSMNVRYYSGKNIIETKKIIKQLIERKIANKEEFDANLKTVIGHTKLEIVAGVIFGTLIAILYKIIFKY